MIACLSLLQVRSLYEYVNAAHIKQVLVEVDLGGLGDVGKVGEGLWPQGEGHILDHDQFGAGQGLVPVGGLVLLENLLDVLPGGGQVDSFEGLADLEDVVRGVDGAYKGMLEFIFALVDVMFHQGSFSFLLALEDDPYLPVSGEAVQEMLDDDGLVGVDKDLVTVGGVVAVEGQLLVGFDGEVLDEVLFGVDEVV